MRIYAGEIAVWVSMIVGFFLSYHLVKFLTPAYNHVKRIHGGIVAIGGIGIGFLLSMIVSYIFTFDEVNPVFFIK